MKRRFPIPQGVQAMFTAHRREACAGVTPEHAHAPGCTITAEDGDRWSLLPGGDFVSPQCCALRLALRTHNNHRATLKALGALGARRAQRMAASIAAFSEECGEAEHTDTDKAWQLLGHLYRQLTGNALPIARGRFTAEAMRERDPLTE